ncbi:unnamed protein product [Lampetra fluviatilis]
MAAFVLEPSLSEVLSHPAPLARQQRPLLSPYRKQATVERYNAHGGHKMNPSKSASSGVGADAKESKSAGHDGVEVEHMDGEPAANGGPEKFFGLSTKEWGLVALGLVAVVGLAVYVKRRD